MGRMREPGGGVGAFFAELNDAIARLFDYVDNRLEERIRQLRRDLGLVAEDDGTPGTPTHVHDTRYYTEAEIDALLAAISGGDPVIFLHGLGDHADVILESPVEGSTIVYDATDNVWRVGTPLALVYAELVDSDGDHLVDSDGAYLVEAL
jgi:hypothetical protein